jgi:hypothetical protein
MTQSVARSVKPGPFVVDDRNHLLPEHHARDGHLARFLEPVSGDHVVSEFDWVAIVGHLGFS